MSKKDWEEPWTPHKIRANADQWKLSSDAGLLMFLEGCSKKMFTAFENTENVLRTLNRDLQLTGVRLETTINDFSMLSNKQFIENRVYDEDVTSLKPPVKKDVDVAKSKEQREQEMSEAIKFCLRQGCSMIDSCFQKIDVLPEDFDESDDPTFKPDPIYEPNDPFANRVLPYIIGTVQFEKSRFVGLKDEASKTEIQQDFSDEEVIEEIIPNASKDQFPTQSIISASAPPPLTVSVPQTIVKKESKNENGPGSDNSGLFSGSAESVNDSLFLTPEKEKPQVRDFKAELNAKLERNDEEKNLKSDTGANKPATAPRKASQMKPKPVTVDDNLFGPPPLPSEKVDSDDDKSLFGVRNDIFAASRTKGLFDDDDEQDSLFSPQPTIRSVTSAERSTVSRHVESRKSTDTVQKPATAVNVNSTSVPDVARNSRVTDLFADDDDDDLFSKPKRSTEKSQISNGKKQISTVSEVAASIPSTSTTLPSVVPKSTTIDKTIDNKFKTKELSEDKRQISDDDDLFSSDMSKLSDKTIIESDDNKETPTKKDNVDSMASVSNITKIPATSKTSLTSGGTETNIPKDSQPANKLLNSNSSATSSGLFGDDDDEDDLFAVAPPKKNSVTASTKVDQLLNKQTVNDNVVFTDQKSNKLSVSLFNESDDDAGDLFSTKSTLDTDKIPSSSMGNRSSYDITVVGDVCVDPLSSGVKMEGRNSIFRDSDPVNVVEEDVVKKPSPPPSSTNLPKDPRKALADILRSGSKKHSDDHNNVEDFVENVASVEDKNNNVNSLLPSLQKTRARIPAASRRPPTKRSPTNVINGFDSSNNATIDTSPSKIEQTVPAVVDASKETTTAALLAQAGKIPSVSNELRNDQTLNPDTASKSELKSQNLDSVIESSSNVYSTTKQSKKNSVFSDDENDDLFSNVPSVSPVTNKDAPLAKPASVASSGKLKSNSIFDNDEESSDEDWFKSSASSAVKNIPSTSNRIESQKKLSEKDEDDIFASDNNTKPRSATKTEMFQAKSKSPAVAKGLFDDDDSDTDIFK